MSVYNLDKLMEETRRLAAEYRRSTGATLPVGPELAKFDAIRLLGLEAAAESEHTIDAIIEQNGAVEKFQIKGRVMFDESKSRSRVGQLNMDADWDKTLLVLMNADYQPVEIYSLSKTVLEHAVGDVSAMKSNNRGALSVSKFKALAELVWKHTDNAATD